MLPVSIPTLPMTKANSPAWNMVNPKASILHVNGITGQGSFELSSLWDAGEETDTVEGKTLRFSMPAALCSYCLGETRIGSEFQMGNVRKIDLQKQGGAVQDRLREEGGEEGGEEEELEIEL